MGKVTKISIMILAAVMLAGPASVIASPTQSEWVWSCQQMPHGYKYCCHRRPSGRRVCCWVTPSGRMVCPLHGG